MAEMVLTDAFVSVGGVDLSDHVKQVTLNYSAEVQDITAMGDTARTKLGGLKDWSADVEFNQDYGAASVDDTLFDLMGTSVALVVRPVNTGGVSATNPNFTGNGIMESYPPLSGSVGDALAASVTFQGSGILTRAVA